MVKCVICNLTLLPTRHGIGVRSLEKIKIHYMMVHGIREDRLAFGDYLRELLTPRESEIIVSFCHCSEEVLVSKKQLALHQLINGCDAPTLDQQQRGGARVGVFNEAPARVKKTRFTVLVSSVSLFEMKYERLVQNLDINDRVLSPLAFLDHAIEKLRNNVHRGKYLLDSNGDWFYGKMQISLGINNTKGNSMTMSTDQGANTLGEVIGAGHDYDLELDYGQKEFLSTRLLEAQENGSGWTLHSISHLTLLLLLNPRNVSAIDMYFFSF